MTSTNWENLPSTNTPLNAANLNKIENRLKTHFIPTNVDNIQGWYLALSGSVTTYNNNAFKLSVVNIFSNKSGTLYVNIRRDDGALRIDAFIWETNTGLNSSHFKLNTFVLLDVPIIVPPLCNKPDAFVFESNFT